MTFQGNLDSARVAMVRTTVTPVKSIKGLIRAGM